MQGVNPIGSIQTIDGNYIDSGSITFEPSTYHFFQNGQDITENIRRADKLKMVNGFDQSIENERVYKSRAYPIGHGGAAAPPMGETSVWKLFGQNMQNSVTLGTGSPTAALNKVLLYGAVALVAYLVIKHVMDGKNK